MITAVVNTPIYIPFTLLDSLGAAETGKVNADFTNDIYLTSSPGTTATGTVSEVSEGRYLITFTPTAAGLWHVAWDVVVDGDTVGFEEIVNAQSSTTATVVSVAGAGGLTRTRAQLRRQIADRFEDLVMLTATANGSTTTLLDTINVNAGTEHFNGREILFTSGTNDGLVRRITGTTSSTGTLTFAAVTASTATNDTADVYNRRGRGFTVAQYNRAINNAINDAYPLGMIEVVATVTNPAAFDAETPEITVPASIIDVLELEYADSSGDYHVLPKARRRGGYGWFADPASGQLRLHGRVAASADGLVLRIHGLGRQDELSSDSDTCALSPEYIVARAAYHLALGAVDNEDHAVRVNIFRDESERCRIKLRKMREPFAARVRSA